MLIVECRFYRATHQNEHLEDVTWAFLSARVTADTSRDETWSLDATVTMEGWRYFDPYLDWVAPVLTVWYPDGTVRQGQLGLYLVLDSPETREEIGGSVALQARDPLYLLARQAFETKVEVPEGRKKLETVRRILDESALTDGSRGQPRYVIRGDDEPFKKPAQWSKATMRLDLCNEISEGAGAYALWTTGTGVILTRERGRSKLRQREPVRAFLANVPEDVDLRRRRLGYEEWGFVHGKIKTKPRSSDLTNEIYLIGGVPWEPRRKARHRVDHPDNKRSDRQERRKSRRQEDRQEEQRRRRYTRWTTNHPLIDDDATAQRVARALMDELSTQNTIVSFSALPDPQPDYMRETITLGLWDAHGGQPIALGSYAVHRVSWALTNTSASMSIDAGRVENADSIMEVA